MEEILKLLSQYGPVGIICGWALFQMNKTQTKLLEIIEKNTRAFDELKGIIEKCQVIHKD